MLFQRLVRPHLLSSWKTTGGSGPGILWSDDKELEEIFNRRFGAGKWRSRPDTQSSPTAPRTRNYSANKPLKANETKKPEEEEYLLVDGYNIIFAWEELRELSKVTIDGARQKLMDILCNYQGYKKCTLILVFDAYKVTGNTGEAHRLPQYPCSVYKRSGNCRPVH